jgi:hypothetical protein
MAQDVSLAAACGLYCGDCEYLGEGCRGCNSALGRPFWTEQFGVAVCPLYDCSVNQKGLEHCGLCADFPCQTFDSMRDPSMSDEEAERSLDKKKKDLLTRKEIGTLAWLEQRT